MNACFERIECEFQYDHSESKYKGSNAEEIQGLGSAIIRFHSQTIKDQLDTHMSKRVRGYENALVGFSR